MSEGLRIVHSYIHTHMVEIFISYVSLTFVTSSTLHKNPFIISFAECYGQKKQPKLPQKCMNYYIIMNVTMCIRIDSPCFCNVT